MPAAERDVSGAVYAEDFPLTENKTRHRESFIRRMVVEITSEEIVIRRKGGGSLTQMYLTAVCCAAPTAKLGQSVQSINLQLDNEKFPCIRKLAAECRREAPTIA